MHVPATPSKSNAAITTPTTAPNGSCELTVGISALGVEVIVERGVMIGRVTVLREDKDCDLVGLLTVVLRKVLVRGRTVEVDAGTEVGATSSMDVVSGGVVLVGWVLAMACALVLVVSGSVVVTIT
jgi:hypothetical protein